MKNLQDIIPCRIIHDAPRQEFAGIQYEEWEVLPPLWGDEVEKLLVEGYDVSMLSNGKINISKRLTPTPEKLRENKQFWSDLGKAIDEC